MAVQTLIVVIIGGLLWALTADAFKVSTVMWMLGAWVVLFVVLFVIQNVRLHAARKDLLDVGEGPALMVCSSGLYLRRALRSGSKQSTTTTMDEVHWDALSEVKVGGSSIGSGPSLVVNAQDGRQWDVPLSWLDSRQTDIDSAIAAASGGRIRVEQDGSEIAD
ncbi:hypothetical protein FYJ43_09465 [Cutibacterium sp. WCA-380-WT-3A]|uniref:Uncharacterized protein n=1 Tax=Cutibacterium porci TaxID=2605781 RepID=A0A7K0J8F6_9ACTN|nr:hypothetical protein [Cutibacterium porci]